MGRLSFTFLFLCVCARAAPVHRAPVGAHYPVFTYEKNENPQNYMVAFVRLDEECRIVSKPGQPAFDYYWMMDGKKHKPVHALIRKGIQKRIAADPLPSDRRRLKLRFQHVKEIDPELRGETVTIVSAKTASGCEARAEFRDFTLTKIFSHAKKAAMPPFRKISWVRISGVKDGREAGHTYDRFN